MWFPMTPFLSENEYILYVVFEKNKINNHLERIIDVLQDFRGAIGFFISFLSRHNTTRCFSSIQ